MEGGLHEDFDLPGFIFHPTEEELVGFYLRKKVLGQPFSSDVIGTLDLYRYDPWQLPDLALVGGREWFFFVPVDKKSATARRSRLTISGYWKATGAEKPVRDQMFECIGLKTTLVFYKGKAPSGEKTDWIMNEYRMPDFRYARKKDIVLCRIHRKASSGKTLNQRTIAGAADFMNISASSNSQNDFNFMNYESVAMGGGSPYSNEEVMEYRSPFKDNKLKLPQLEVPKLCVENLFSPWIETWTPSTLLCTPKEDWSNISGYGSIPISPFSIP